MNIETLKSIGEERKGGKYHRIYFHNLAELYGLDVQYSKNGCVESAKCQGEEISVKEASNLLRTLIDGVVWYNIKTGNFGGKNIDDECYCEIVAQIQMLASDFEQNETFLFQSEYRDTFFKFDGKTYEADDFEFSKKVYTESEKTMVEYYKNEDGVYLKKVITYFNPVVTKWYVLPSGASEEVETGIDKTNIKSYIIGDEYPVPGEDSVEGYRYIKAKTGAEIREEARKEAEEQNNGEPEEETEGDESNMTYYNSIYDYVQGADLSYYEIADGTIRETPFIEEITPAQDPDFVIFSRGTKHEGEWYTEVNFGENDESWLMDSALYETVYLVYIEESEGHYVTDGRVYETEEEAKASI